MNIAYQARVVLIDIGKMLPFIICFLLLISYTEGLVSMVSADFIEFGDYVTLNKPISHWIGGVFEYDALIVVVLVIMAYALETCYWNKLAVLYLLLHLIFKNYVQDIVFDETEVYIFSIVNAAISFFLSYKGAEILVKHG